MDVEEGFRIVGACGRYQAFLFFTIASSNILMAFQMVLMVFVGATPELKAGKGGKLEPVGMHTVVDEWNLRGDREYIVSTLQAVFMLGVLIGNVTIGQMSDIYGRKAVYFKVMFLLVFVSFLTTFSSDWRIFCALRFFSGLCQGGAVLVGFVLGQELVGSSVWPITGAIMPALFSVGITILAGLASIFTDWRSLCIVTSLPGFVFLLNYWILPESPRWLYSQGKVAAAEQVLHYLARRNGRSSSAVASIVLEKKKLEKKSSQSGYSVKDLFSSRNLAKRTLIMAYTWFVCSFTYYGLTMAASDLADSLYVSVALSGIVELPATVCCAFFLSKVWAGRKKTLIVALLLGGSLCLSIMLLHDASVKSTAKSALALGGKFGVSAGFCIIYIYASELYPTVVRNVGMGTSSMSARVGGILAPYVHLLVVFGARTPYLVYGLLSVVAAGLILLLPETLNQPVPDTLEDVADDPVRRKRKKRNQVQGLDDEEELLSNDGEEEYIKA